MATNYSANQFESAYKPRLLRNWEIPKYYPSCQPQKRVGKTAFIANTKGHLLPGIPRSHKSPWGELVPNKAKRNQQNEQEVKESSLEEDINHNKISPKALEKAVPFVPGDLTEEKHRPLSHQVLQENRLNVNPVKSPRNGFPKVTEDFSRKSPEPEHVDNFYEKHKEMLHASRVAERKPDKKDRLLTPILAAISNFSLAKKLHKENLEHVPLPDTVTHSLYQKLQMKRDGVEPGLGLEDQHFVTGVGWKSHVGYAPTKCTKLKIYRPHTTDNTRRNKYYDDRPSSVSSFDKKWRFIKQTKVSPIDLAICWDLTPENKADEPKRTTHIDGSNGSQAPAIFSVVNTPKESPEAAMASEKCDGIHGCGPIFVHGPPANNGREFIFDRLQTTSQKSHSTSESSKRSKSAYDLQNISPKCSDCSLPIKTSKQIIEKRHISTPNLSEDSSNKCSSKDCQKPTRQRLCLACDLKRVTLQDKAHSKDQFKMAFKAGVPHKPSVSKAKCLLRVPPQRVPFCTRGYEIRSLAPPFSLQKDRRQEYPEHWRLATVYQHSYKPLQFRKRPLMATVFK